MANPPEIVKSLGEFDLDPCSPGSRRPWDTAKNHYAIGDGQDGLSLPWIGRIWLNPPFGKAMIPFVHKFLEHGDGVSLIPARTDTKLFHEKIFLEVDAILFLKGRITFYHVQGIKSDFTLNAPVCFLAKGKKNVEALRTSGLRGTLIERPLDFYP